MQGITVAYSGVHQAYQLALAASELGQLDCFYCSLFDAPGKWGALASSLLGRNALVNRQCAGIPPAKVSEIPWPLVLHQIRSKVISSSARDWFVANGSFDSCVAARLKSSTSRVFVGSETCAEKSFGAARGRGMVRVLDCPQWHPKSLNLILEEGARRMGLQKPMPLDTSVMAARKEREFASADWLLVYSGAHRRSFEEAGVPASRLYQCPLWVDQGLWHPEERLASTSKALRVIFAGTMNLRKGIFFLLEAIKQSGKSMELTLAGRADDEGRVILRKSSTPYVRSEFKPRRRCVSCMPRRTFLCCRLWQIHSDSSHWRRWRADCPSLSPRIAACQCQTRRGVCRRWTAGPSRDDWNIMRKIGRHWRGMDCWRNDLRSNSLLSDIATR